jgi:hypothetical protein
VDLSIPDSESGKAHIRLRPAASHRNRLESDSHQPRHLTFAIHIIGRGPTTLATKDLCVVRLFSPFLRDTCARPAGLAYCCLRDMAIPQAAPATLGVLAVLATVAVVVIYSILGQSLANGATSATRVTSALSATLEGLALLCTCILAASYLPIPLATWNARWKSTCSIVGLVASNTAMAFAIAALVCFSTVPRQSSSVLGSDSSSFLVGAAVVLGLSYAMQLIFFVIHYIMSRKQGRSGSVTPGLTREPQTMTHHGTGLRSIPYSHTSPGRQSDRDRESSSLEVDAKRAPSAASKRSTSETMGSIRSSISQIVRPTHPIKRLVPGSQRSEDSRRSTSQRSSKRPPSLDSATWKEPSLPALDGFDTWDTSAVESAAETSSPPPPRILETIPASPTNSRSPSPGTPLNLESLKKSRRRSRSYSPASTVRTARPQRSGVSLRSTDAEAHIHPLFRSDSPVPPPAVTPNTVVTAAPNAGQVISDRQSIRSLSRMRSGSLPTAPSPLSRQSSFDDFALKRDTSSPELSISESPELLEEEDEEEAEKKADSERTMTPPIPDWILSAGSRKSLTGYLGRRTRESSGEPSSESS